METSGTTRFLKGKLYPGQSSPVVDITKQGNLRMVHLRDGTTLRTTKASVLKAFAQVMSGHQAVGAKKSLRVNSKGEASVTLGGAQKGERKTYVSKKAALAAIERKYGK